MATRVADIGTNRAFTGIDLGDDRELVLAFQSGDDDAYAGIYLKYRNLAAQICYRILQDRDEVEEAVQETMLRVYRGLPRFNGRYQLQAWVARIATNVSLDMIRARSRRPQRAPALHDISEEFETLAGPSADDSIDELERILDQEEVRGILSAIPEHHRDALVLREFEGRSHEEIASAMGVSPDQAKALIHRAKKSFRRAWDGEVERRGIAALAPILLAPFKLPGFLRRLAQPAHDAVANVAATAQQAAV
ncbi:MAG: RNA polymerase sigma factor, partial [Actinomycetota bacterium]